MTLVREGPAAAWEKIKEHLTNFKEMVVEEITNFVAVRIVQNAVTKLLMMLDPSGIGAIVQTVLAIYNTIMFFVERLRQMIQVVRSFIDSITAIARGVIAAAANRVETSLAGVLTLAISFLARLAGLGRVSTILTSILNRVRQPIDRALDKVVEWIVRTARSFVGGVRGAAARLFNWGAARRSFEDEEGKSHSIYVQADGGAPRLMIRSDPLPASEFLVWYKRKRSERNPQYATRNEAKIRNVEAAIAAVERVITEIDEAKEANREQSVLDGLQGRLLDENVALSNALRLLTSGDRSIGTQKEKYLLEGQTGTYGSMPKPPGDDFEADHQPANSILEAAAEYDFFEPQGNLARRAARRSAAGYAINLHKIRHREGRTWGSKATATRATFLSNVNADLSGETDPARKRRIVVRHIKAELEADVDKMKKVVNKPLTHPNWQDVSDLEGTDREKQDLHREIQGRIDHGEDQLARQPIDSLAD